VAVGVGAGFWQMMTRPRAVAADHSEILHIGWTDGRHFNMVSFRLIVAVGDRLR